jgi:hypothetical protein
VQQQQQQQARKPQARKQQQQAIQQGQQPKGVHAMQQHLSGSSRYCWCKRCRCGSCCRQFWWG